jgi:hypothetical protein
VKAFGNGLISKGKAARMLMIGESDFEERFASTLDLELVE